MATKKKKKDELTEEILPEAGLVDELVEQTGDKSEDPDLVSVDDKKVDSILSTYLGDEMLGKLRENATISNFVEIDDADNALVFGGATRNDIKFVQFRDGEDFINDSWGKIEIASIEQGSLSPAGMFSDERIKKTIEDKIARLGSGAPDDDKRARRAQR
ncbi:MAG: hypothetical protein KAS36_05525, partial [Anaerolineales bacterium]|nr:hypothetical protein [Anaerolineales bacterium]